MNYKQIALSVLAAAVVAAGVAAVLVKNRSLGGVKTVAEEYPNGIKIGDYTFNTAKLTVGTSTHEAWWRNTTGKTVYVSEREILFTQGSGRTASSTFFIEMATSTSSNPPDNIFFDHPSLMPRLEIATGTPVNGFYSVAASRLTGTSTQVVGDGFSTTSTQQIGKIIRRGNDNLASLPVVPILDGDYALLHILDVEAADTASPCQPTVNQRETGTDGGIFCEYATSTNRGFNLEGRLFYFY